MANLIAVVGSSGQGKSTSIRTLDPEKTFVFSVTKKPLPFKGAKSKYRNFMEDKEKGNFLATNSVESIVKVLKFIDLKRPDIKNIIIDDKV